jgi:hypothetical protein
MGDVEQHEDPGQPRLGEYQDGPAGEPAASTTSGRRRPRRWIAVIGGTIPLLVAAVGAIAAFGSFEHAYWPRRSDVVNPPRPIPGLIFDVWGKDVMRDEADRRSKTQEGRASLTPARVAVSIGEKTLRLGEDAF